jgi:hypothetical protein
MTNDTKPIKVPNAEHPITIDADTVRVLARVGETVIADSTATLPCANPGTRRCTTSH